MTDVPKEPLPTLLELAQQLEQLARDNNRPGLHPDLAREWSPRGVGGPEYVEFARQCELAYLHARAALVLSRKILGAQTSPPSPGNAGRRAGGHRRCRSCNHAPPRHVSGCKLAPKAAAAADPRQRELALLAAWGCPHAIGTADVCEPCRQLLGAAP